MISNNPKPGGNALEAGVVVRQQVKVVQAVIEQSRDERLLADWDRAGRTDGECNFYALWDISNT